MFILFSFVLNGMIFFPLKAKNWNVGMSVKLFFRSEPKKSERGQTSTADADAYADPTAKPLDETNWRLSTKFYNLKILLFSFTRIFSGYSASIVNTNFYIKSPCLNRHSILWMSTSIFAKCQMLTSGLSYFTTWEAIEQLKNLFHVI